MLINLLLIVVGIVMVLKGADVLTKGGADLARRMNVSELVVGLTIVAAGTSAPELFVSLVSALKGTPDLAVGNVVGSNIMNTLVIVGVTAMVSPIAIARQTVAKDMPFTVVASVLLMVLALDRFQSVSLWGNVISRLDGILLLLGFAAFMYYTFTVARHGDSRDEKADKKPASVVLCLVLLVAGLALLVAGSELFVRNASSLAAALGVSEGVIGLTIVAGGTSLPELATSIVAARKGRSALAIGNVIGSNVFNILLILGLTATVCPMQIGDITMIDMGMMVASMLLLWLFSFTKLTVARWEGAVLTAVYLGYLAWLLYNV
jgi:cation:H+ antiporter